MPVDLLARRSRAWGGRPGVAKPPRPPPGSVNAMSPASSYRRPIGVTVIVALMFLQAVLGAVSGLVFVLGRHNASLLRQTDASSSTVLGIGIALLAIAAITLLLAYLLARGSNLVRWLLAVAAAAQLGASAYELIRFAAGRHSVGGVRPGGAIASCVVSLVVLLILFVEPGSREFFTGRRSRLT